LLPPKPRDKSARKAFIEKLLTALFLFLTSCSQNIYPGRSQFLKDGDPLPTVDLNYYKSVQERPE